ncbi:hypothetical protein ACFQQE_06655 [Glycomyces mayteni]|nr:hypothetical protein GCM10025732_10790 [Glycomyces mayteni]
MKDFQRAASDVAEQYDLASIGAPWSEPTVREGVHRMHTARTAYAGRDPRTPPALWDGRRYHVAFPDGVMRPIDPPAQPVMPLPLAPPPPPPTYLVAYPVTHA